MSTTRGYYLLCLCNARKALSQQRLRLSRPLEVNDPFELAALGWRTREEQKRIEKFKKEVNDRLAMLCLLKGWKDPVPWSHYADRHRGVCLGFEVDTAIGEGLREISYVHAMLRADGHSGPLGALAHDVKEALKFTKFQSWSYEQELRAFVPLTKLVDEPSGDGKTLYFMPFGGQLKLREVILGPLCDRRGLLAEFKKLVATNKEPVDVHCARLGRTAIRVKVDGKFAIP
jgi:hypothetical protein